MARPRSTTAGTHVQNFKFDITKASATELKKIQSIIVEGLTNRPQSIDLASSHDRHYSTHSSG